MAKQVSLGQGVSSVLFWSLVSAAFIGPGTVTTAARAGADFQLTLLWALLFSTLATILLQEAAARASIASRKRLGEIIALKYPNEIGENASLLLFLAVSFGCAAYQAGNLLGAMSGILLLTSWHPKLVLLLIGLFCASMLWVGNIKFIARTLGIVVALMGVLFVYVAMQTDNYFYNVLEASIIPSFPPNSALLIISLIGTTIVPYNLFLAMGISQGQSISEMRWGVGIAVLFGGIISMCILIVGTSVNDEFSFENLATAIAGQSAQWAAYFFAFGLFAAGLSSAITAPLAAAITAQTLFQKSGLPNAQEWSSKGLYFRLVWGVVLIIGLLFSLFDVQPIPAIILAQAINGVLLPIVAIFLLLVVNDIRLFPDGYTNTFTVNLLMLIVVGVACFLGLYNLYKALASIIASPLTTHQVVVSISIATFAILAWVIWRIFVSRR
ncbi:MAG: divalent metal cation transporter [Saprospiraceae bacterium]|nr:divalent metal cation transporter [Saprospiraceae bacterium]